MPENKQISSSAADHVLRTYLREVIDTNKDGFITTDELEANKEIFDDFMGHREVSAHAIAQLMTENYNLITKLKVDLLSQAMVDDKDAYDGKSDQRLDFTAPISPSEVVGRYKDLAKEDKIPLR